MSQSKEFIVSHKKFGRGTAYIVDSKDLVVTFEEDGSKRTFPYPSAIMTGYIIPENPNWLRDLKK